MKAGTLRPTVDELFGMLQKTSLPTILVEGKDDIIFYRRLEEELSSFGVDVLPAGNKDAVLELMDRLEKTDTSVQFVYIVDKDTWVHDFPVCMSKKENLITTEGYSIENDLFIDGDLEALLSHAESLLFQKEISKFTQWYALAIHRYLSGSTSSFRTHPGKVLDDSDFYEAQTILENQEQYPDDLKKKIIGNYSSLLRGKSLLSILHRQLSKSGRDVKFSGKQLMEFGGSRKGEKFKRLKSLVVDAFQ